MQRVADRWFADVKLPANANRRGDLAGTYQPTRRADSNLFKLRVLFEQVSVQSTPDGKLVAAGITLDEIEPERYRGPGLEIAFVGVGSGRVMQLEAPALYVPLPWWARRDVTFMALSVCVSVAALTFLGDALTWIRRRHAGLDPITRRLKSATRVALFMNLASIAGTVWLVIWGWPLVATSSVIVTTLVLGVYASAWGAILLTPIAVWQAARFARRGAGGLLARCWECLVASAVVILSGFCIYWRIAGTSLSI